MRALCVPRPAGTPQSASECTRRCSSSSRRAVWGRSWCWTTFPSCWIACGTATWPSAGWCCTLQTRVRLCCTHCWALSPAPLGLRLGAWGKFSPAAVGVSSFLCWLQVCRRSLSCCFANSLLKPCLKWHMHFLSSCEPNKGTKISRSHNLVE